MSTLAATELRISAAVEEADPDGVLTWRYQSLRRGGYDPDAAARLANARNVDLHEAVELRERGCNVRLALRILL